MIDLVKLTLLAGNGGNGRVSFRREKYIPKGGPDGGNGGKGGSIIIIGNKNLNTLEQFAGVKVIQAKSGEGGGKKKKSGSNAEDIILEVPVGTVIWALSETKKKETKKQKEKYYLETESRPVPSRPDQGWLDSEGKKVSPKSDDFKNHSVKNLNLKQVFKHKLIEITQDGQEYVVCKGGKGGRGNDAFKAPDNRIPLEAEYGEFGEGKQVILELKLLADIGLVGFPSVGKSTFISTVTKAKPKIADYPFTTLEANLGVWNVGGSPGVNAGNAYMRSIHSLVVADIPGLIEGASKGKGLGYEFLRHVERCKALIFILDPSENVLSNLAVQQPGNSNEDRDKRRENKIVVDSLKKQFEQLRDELAEYEPELLEKPYLIVINKADLLSPDLATELRNTSYEIRDSLLETRDSKMVKPVLISCATREGLEELKKQVIRLISN